MNVKFSWQFKALMLYAISGVIITCGSFAFAIETDDMIFCMPLILGLSMLLSVLYFIMVIPVFIEGVKE